MEEIFTVSTLTLAIKHTLELKFFSVCIKGEISNFKAQSSGHLYFTLKDSEAQISCVLFRSNAKALTRSPQNGDQVIIQGELNVYPPRGNYQIIARSLSYMGVGELLVKWHQLKTKLEQMGFFEKEKKKPLPKYPKRIGVITSATGAVIQDILQILKRRAPGLSILLNPVTVQGETAAKEIAQAIEDFNKYQLADVLIVGRGGGSLEDLWAFNEEIVACAIYYSKIPIISAVGHETDTCIADFVADQRAPTPSAAAELVTVERAQQITYLNRSYAQLKNAITSHLRSCAEKVHFVSNHPFIKNPHALLEPHFQRVDSYAIDVNRCFTQIIQKKGWQLSLLTSKLHHLRPSHQLQEMKQKIEAIETLLQQTILHKFYEYKNKLSSLAWYKKIDLRQNQLIYEKKSSLTKIIALLKAADPKYLLTKGYGILFHEKNDSVIISTKEVIPNQQVRLMLQDGQLGLTIHNIKSL
ncbi:Exodeoxyribonuclease 7 large subunit [Candidatus Rhabdochlamydia oedothoracis]|uniref:Exodeoxyribonuclease 7 large subunit n=2 Tax=Candidatus Rhabdochlamydia oedothoracis TaxID=2720720 RepID=A0ABX8V5S7_9BACT|nr:exodeoxyribonuclease VII large subunit [Candidatus Rhabdochlamydia sp. W815]KAG6559578.1 Exodeoxyribonuclease 7 large subunit [Candidatus Rhabdochlamydia sp. W815]MCL6755932.1 exodeoxyribonuclease VII large subunit [Candidatus Rhabdochlamydia oedothoracis]QYF48815.1 Exodeoxyribonuclease 7 large subunit [Candidatus Rhabdochlamydia oedothoracis]